MPVYALFTKADLIAGFTEFFDDLDRETRGQVWGMTFPLAPGPARIRSPVSPPNSSALVERLNAAPVPPAAGGAQPGAAQH